VWFFVAQHPARIPAGHVTARTSSSVPAGFDEFVTEAGVPATSSTLPRAVGPDMAGWKLLAAKHQIERPGPLPVCELAAEVGTVDLETIRCL
jgi:hypothetical protein